MNYHGKDGGVCNYQIMVDVVSMYPSQILSFNVSPETIQKFTPLPKEEVPLDVIERYRDDKIIEIYISDDSLKLYGIATYSAEKGIIPSMTEMFFEKKTVCGTKGHPEYNPVKRQVYKIFLNSLYGAYGQVGGILYTLYNGCAITHTSRVVLYQSMSFIKN